MSWRPILDPATTVEAGAIIREIAEAVTGATSADYDLLLWAYLASSTLDDEAIQAHHERAVARFADTLHTGVNQPTLFSGGLAGFGWVAAHTVDDGEELLDVIDSQLVRVLDVPHWPGSYDLITGLVGYGVYFLERQAPAAEAGMKLVVAHLAETARREDDRTWWFTPPELLPTHQRAHSPNGYINCGVAHGVPGVVAMLSRHLQRTPDDRIARDLRDGAVAWLSAQRSDDPRDRFPSQLDERPRSRSRTAWCYGDPGVTTALWSASPSAAHEADMLAALSRSSAEAHVVDAEVCHGAAGLGHLANRWFNATGNERFRELARGWFARTLELRTPGIGVAGFRSLQAGEWMDSPAFLDGALGIALALLSAATPIEPAWDRLLLIDLPILPD